MKDIIKQWKEEAIGSAFRETTIFHVDDNKVYIITKYPGLFIGYHGELVKKYEAILGKKVEFVPVTLGNNIIEF